MIEKTLTRISSYPDHQVVRQDPGPACDRAAITARFSYDRRGFSCYGRFIYRRDTLDHLAITGDDLSGRHNNFIIFPKFVSRDILLYQAILNQPVSDGRRACFSQGIGLSFASSFGYCFGEIGKQDSEPKPNRNLQRKAETFTFGSENEARGSN